MEISVIVHCYLHGDNDYYLHGDNDITEFHDVVE